MVASWRSGWQRSPACWAPGIVQLRPFDPESKGIVERVNGYLETSFLPGRSFVSPADFNDQLADWLPRANSRRVRALAARPADLIGADRAGMRPLPTSRADGRVHRATGPVAAGLLPAGVGK